VHRLDCYTSEIELNRRQFVVLTAVTCAGCKTAGRASTGPMISRTVDAGLDSQYAADGVYDAFRNDGFFIVREGDNLFAISAVCTHRDCKLRAQPDHTFYCKCHGSRFSEEGKVTKGPATRDLPHFEMTAGDDKHLMVKVMRPEFDEE
jgi:Rieske Fe-S protein